MNRVVLVGRLARDPNELRRSVNGVAAISFTIAVDSRSKQENHTAEYIPCTAFNKTAEFVSMYFKKGLQVAIDGRLQSRDYEKDGRKVYVVEVVCENVQILDPKKNNQDGVTPTQIQSEEPASSSSSIGIDIGDDDLQF